MPNRIIKESICSSDSIERLSWFEECFFYRLIVNADDYGRLDARPAMLRARLFPLKSVTDKQIGDALNKLATVGMVLVYEYDQKPFLQLTSWNSHQQIRAKKSKYPAPDSSCKQMISDDSKCPRNPIQSESNLSPPDDGGLRIDDLFDRTYAAYPLKKGKAKGKAAYRLYLVQGKEVSGERYRLNHQQIYIAVSRYAVECEGKEPQFIKHFDTFMNGPVVDYVEETREQYAAFMREKYGESWEKVRFTYA